MRGIFLMVAATLTGCATDHVDMGPDTDWAAAIQAADSLTSSSVMYQSAYQVPTNGNGPIQTAEIRRVNGEDQFVTPDQSTDYFVQIELDPAGYVDGDLLNIRLHGHDTGTFVFGALFRTIPDDAMVTHMYGPDSTAWYQFRFTRPGIGLGSMEQIAPRTMMPH